VSPVARSGFSSGDDDKFPVRMMRTGPVAGPHSVNRRSKVFRGIELSSAIAVGADKIRVAELGNCLYSVYFTAGPQIATGKSGKTRRRGRPDRPRLAGCKRSP